LLAVDIMIATLWGFLNLNILKEKKRLNKKTGELLFLFSVFI